MTEILSFKIPKKGKIFVKESDRVNCGTVLTEGEEEGEKEILRLSEVFKISPCRIFKFLVKNLGDHLKKGEILAKKEGVFGKIVLKSPINGRLAEVSQVSGEVILVGEDKKVIVKSPVAGRVRSIGKDEVEIEFEGVVFTGKSGGGKRAFGAIENLPPEVSVLELPFQIQKKILVCSNFSAPVLAKAWALKARGLVGSTFSVRLPLPFLMVGKKDIKSLRGYQEKKAILEPSSKRLIIQFE